MTRRRKTAIKGAPLTNREAAGFGYTTYAIQLQKGRLILCSRCHTPGGTLRKDKNTGTYYHADMAACRLMQLRRGVMA